MKPTKAHILDNETKRRSKRPDSAASFGSARRVRTAGQLKDAVRSVQVRDIRGRLHPSTIPFKFIIARIGYASFQYGSKLR